MLGVMMSLGVVAFWLVLGGALAALAHLANREAGQLGNQRLERTACFRVPAHQLGERAACAPYGPAVGGRLDVGKPAQIIERGEVKPDERPWLVRSAQFLLLTVF